jgi:hypothetical protein
LQNRGRAIAAGGDRAGRSSDFFYEYESQTTLFGVPLIHITFAPVWLVGFRPARGIIAVGNMPSASPRLAASRWASWRSAASASA